MGWMGLSAEASGERATVDTAGVRFRALTQQGTSMSHAKVGDTLPSLGSRLDSSSRHPGSFSSGGCDISGKEGESGERRVGREGERKANLIDAVELLPSPPVFHFARQCSKSFETACFKIFVPTRPAFLHNTLTERRGSLHLRVIQFNGRQSFPTS